jgi:hypothetical protein
VDKDIKKMKKLVDFMRKQGVLCMKLDDLEIELSPSALFPEEKLQAEPEQSDPNIPTAHELTLEEIALWSAPGGHFQS